MARKRMSWDWVGEYPVFVYTVWLGHRVFQVDVIIGIKGDQNAGSHGPKDKPDHSYVENEFYSKDKVVDEAFAKAKRLLHNKESKNV